MKNLDIISGFGHVAFVDDERSMGNSIIVTLKDDFFFVNDPTCGVQGFDNVKDALNGTRACMIYHKNRSLHKSN